MVFCVYFVSIILSKFQPAMVLLSGLIFTCPVPSPAVTFRVKSTILKEFFQTTKVCEPKKGNRLHKLFTFCKCMTLCWVSCMNDVVFFTPWKVSSKMDDSAFSVTTIAFHCDISYNLLKNTSFRLMLKGTVVHHCV